MAPITTNEEGEFTAQLKGEFHWDLIIDIDNTNNVSVTTKRALAVVSEVSLSYDALVRSLESTPRGGPIGGGTLEVLSVGVNGDLHPEVKAAYENLPQSKTASVKKPPTEAVTYEVGPGSSFKLHRLVFKAPGVTYLTDTLSTSTDAIPHVPIEVKGRLLPAMKGIAASAYSSVSASELKGSPTTKMAKLAKDEGHFKAELQGEFYWELFMEIDNSQSSGTITRDMEVETVVSLSHKNMVRSVESNTKATSIGYEYGGGLDVFSISVKGNLSSEVKSQYENLTETKIDRTTTTKKTDSYKVGPNGKLTYYRLIFRGPGVAYMTDTISSKTDIRPSLPIEIIGRRIPVLKGIQVVYTDDALSHPDDIIYEARGLDSNLCAGWNQERHDGPNKYLWLRPIWTVDLSEGVTGIQIANQSEPNESYEDLLKGVGYRRHRYLKMLRDPHSKQRITEIALWQVTKEDSSSPAERYKFSAAGVSYDYHKNVMYLAWNAREFK